MRAILAGLLFTVASAHADCPRTPAELREDMQSRRMQYEAQLAVIADRDIQTARIQEDNARTQLRLARSRGDAKQVSYWGDRLDQAMAAEQEALGRFVVHQAGREIARAELRKAIAESRQIKAQQARR
jgi:hypothetical protein